MNGHRAASFYITRPEEESIRRMLEDVRADRVSRAVLLYGAGGVGKTSLVRHMAVRDSDDRTVWVLPIDVDDPEIWLLSNLESRVASQLDPEQYYFAEYWRQLSRLPSTTRRDISHETIISHLNRLREIFARCYRDYATQENRSVVVLFDSVEAIRETNQARTLTQWLKAFPTDTLFILSGRPPAGGRDRLRSELDSRYRSMPVASVEVRGFRHADARDYIRNSDISRHLSSDEEEALVLLSRGHPLWLAFLIDYLGTEGVPPEATRYPLDVMDRHLPFDCEMTMEGRQLHEDFLRRLMAPYQEADFWNEATKRLAVVRQPVEKRVWQRLMGDRAQQAASPWMPHGMRCWTGPGSGRAPTGSS